MQQIIKKLMKTSIVIFVLGMIAGFGYLTWLDSGCALQGVMTWHGKVCVN